jgi:hypothetical protein
MPSATVWSEKFRWAARHARVVGAKQIVAARCFAENLQTVRYDNTLQLTIFGASSCNRNATTTCEKRAYASSLE